MKIQNTASFIQELKQLTSKKVKRPTTTHPPDHKHSPSQHNLSFNKKFSAKPPNQP